MLRACRVARTSFCPLVILGVVSAQAQETSVASIYSRAAVSVAVIISIDENMQPLAYGSGFFVDATGALATNYHVITGAHSIGVRLRGSGEPLLVEGVLAIDTLRDLALLKVPTASVPIPLTIVRPTVGERVIAIGNPLGLESSVSEGIVSGIRQVAGTELYQITAPISPGSSGGPVLNLRGEVLGIATASLGGGQNLNFAVPTGDLDRLRKAATSPRPVPQSTRARLAPRALDNEKPTIRVVDVRGGSYRYWSAVLFNGSQFHIRNVVVRVICWKGQLDVPIGFYDAQVASQYNPIPDDPIPPGLSEEFQFYCREGTTRPEFRILDYVIVR